MTKNPRMKRQARLFSIAQLAQDFKLDRKTVAKRLSDCPACGESRGYPAYTLANAAPFLVAPVVRGEEESFEDVDPDTLSPDMQKDYWDAQIKKLKWNKDAGHLWDDLEVVSVLSDIFKIVSQKLRTIPDVLDSLALDVDQVDAAEKIVFSGQEDMYQALVLKYGGEDDTQECVENPRDDDPG